MYHCMNSGSAAVLTAMLYHFLVVILMTHDQVVQMVAI